MSSDSVKDFSSSEKQLAENIFESFRYISSEIGIRNTNKMHFNT